MKTRYSLGVMDLYPIASNKTQIENNPFFQACLTENADPQRLRLAVSQALEDHPLFKTALVYRKQWFLETNDADFPLFHATTEQRPLEFGDNTNGYPWQICYNGPRISFEWCHAVSDGRGGCAFFTAILRHYFGIHTPVAPALGLGLEQFYDPSQPGLGQKKQEKGFRAKDLPYLKQGYRTDCHILKAPMVQVLAAAKRSDSSPAAVLPPLFSMALRRHIRPEAKNKNVSCNVVIDCRSPMSYETMHNCILSKVITYVDRFDSMDFPLVSTIYRAILDLAVQRENVVAEATKTVSLIKPIVSIRPWFLQKALGKIVAAALKHSDSNFTFTYLGKLQLEEEVMKNLADFNFRSWTDFGECNIAAVDLNGTLILNICENYVDKQIIPDYIRICEEQGIHFEYGGRVRFEQANLRSEVL